MVFKDDIALAFVSQQDWLFQNQFTNRDYLAGFQPTAWHVEVITGVRRCGKSTLIRQIAKVYYQY